MVSKLLYVRHLLYVSHLLQVSHLLYVSHLLLVSNLLSIPPSHSLPHSAESLFTSPTRTHDERLSTSVLLHILEMVYIVVVAK